MVIRLEGDICECAMSRAVTEKNVEFVGSRCIALLINVYSSGAGIIRHAGGVNHLPTRGSLRNNPIRVQIERDEPFVEQTETECAFNRHSGSFRLSASHYCRIKNCEFV